MENDAVTKPEVTAARESDRELVVRRNFNAPAKLLFDAWSKAELFSLWWVPKSSGLTLLSCAMDVRVGGSYRLKFGHASLDQPMAFFGTYLDVVPDKLIAWTNDESPDGAVTTVTFEAQGQMTMLVVRNLFPTKDALDAEIASGATSGMNESLDQLASFLATEKRG